MSYFGGTVTSRTSHGIGAHGVTVSSRTSASTQKPIAATCGLTLECSATRSSSSPAVTGTPSSDWNVPLAIGPGSCRIGRIVLYGWSSAP